MAPVVLRIGPHKLLNNVLLAPMAGLTDAPFRELVLELGAGYAVAEMVSDQPALWDTDKSRLRRVHPRTHAPVVQQIAGSEPGPMATMARRLTGEGAQIIDINFGCPMKKVCRKAAGSALLREPDLVARIVDAVVAAVDVPVTVKMRTGWSPEQRNALHIARLAEEAGAAALVVHGRTRACRFNGTAEHDTVRRIKQSVAIPVIANGDITDVETARAILARTGVDGVMIGRAAIGAPWLPGEIAGHTPPSRAERLRIIRRHVALMHEHYGEQTGVRVARKHVKAYLGGLRLEAAAGDGRPFMSLEEGAAQREWLAQLAA